MRITIEGNLCGGISKYPCVGKATVSNEVVLFHDCWKGIVLHKGNGSHDVGDYVTNWAMGAFELHPGHVRISND